MLVALTGWAQDEDRRECKDAGFDAHLVKAVDYGAFMKLLGCSPLGALNDRGHLHGFRVFDYNER